MKIFGIGWAKTGTTTLGRCLELLGSKRDAEGGGGYGGGGFGGGEPSDEEVPF